MNSSDAQIDPEQARLKLQREFSGENETGPKEESLRLKDVGNELFRQKKFAQAIEAYTQAIVSVPSLSSLISHFIRCMVQSIN